MAKKTSLKWLHQPVHPLLSIIIIGLVIINGILIFVLQSIQYSAPSHQQEIIQAPSVPQPILPTTKKNNEIITIIISGFSSLRPIPIQFLFTSPNGLQTGYQASTGAYLKNIPNTTYGIEGGIADLTGRTAGQNGRIYYQQDSHTDGTFMLQIFGIGNGPYSIEFDGINDTGADVKSTIYGTAMLGKTDVYLVTISKEKNIIKTVKQQD